MKNHCFRLFVLVVGLTLAESALACSCGGPSWKDIVGILPEQKQDHKYPADHPETRLAERLLADRHNLKKRLSSNGSVFFGKVRSIIFLDEGNEKQKSEPAISVTFDVVEVWYGPPRKTIIVNTIYNSFSCRGYYFKENQYYFVSARSVTSDDELLLAEVEGVSLCGGTSSLEYDDYEGSKLIEGVRFND